MIEHRSVINLAVAQARGLAVTQASRVLQFASPSFDASVWELVMALCQGAALVLPEEGEILVGETLVRRIRNGQITHVTLPPAALATIDSPSGIDGVEVLILAGEAPNWGRTKAFMSARSVFNAYGPTEATVCTTWWRCEQGAQLSIGMPIGNTQTYILDPRRRPVPIGVQGELYIAGDGLARGYLNRPALTVERFVPNSFRADERMYRTGDLARFRPDGTIDYLGRNDDQVKIRGYRIEPGEIEACLATHPQVREAAVIVQEALDGDSRLLAYYTSTPAIGPDQARAHVSTRLPPHMMPAMFVPLDTMPLTSNGKINRKALPALYSAVLDSGSSDLPKDSIEQEIAAAFAEALGLTAVGRHDNLFQLGGHSLMVVRLVSRLRARHPGLTPVDLFTHQTPESLAAYVRRATQPGGDKALVLREGNGGTPLFLVHDGAGQLMYASALAAEMPSERTVLGLPAQPLSAAGSETIEGLAAGLIVRLREAQPHGPYSLGGHSLGGMIAYEMAAQLERVGEAVTRVLLLDTVYPQGYAEQGNLGEAHGEPASDLTALDSTMTRFRDVAGTALAQYRAPFIQTPVTLIVAGDQRHADPLLGWERVVPPERLDVVTVRGDHYSMLLGDALPFLSRKVDEAAFAATSAPSANDPLQAKAITTDEASQFVLMSND
jgi:thioesterase domain-containing protein/aryl carrier-like protein